MRSTVTTSRYDVCTHRASLKVSCRSADTTGSATATMLESRVARKTPIEAMNENAPSAAAQLGGRLKRRRACCAAAHEPLWDTPCAAAGPAA